MKTKAFFLMALAAISMTSCNRFVSTVTDAAKNELKATHEYRDSEKWGKVVEVVYDLKQSAYNNIEIEGNVEVFFTQDSLYSVKAEGNEKAIEAYDIDWSNEGTLSVKIKDNHIKSKKGISISSDTPAITIYATAPSLTDVTLSGAGDIDFDSDLTQSESLNIEIYGAGDFEAKQLNVASFSTHIDGAGDVTIKNLKCEGNADITINGAGDIDAKIKCANASLEVNGAGDIDLNVKCNELKAECNGAGDIKLKGECNKLIKSDGPLGGIDSRNLKVNNKIDIEK